MKSLLVLLPLFFLHTASLWSPGETLAGGYGDPLAHAGIPDFYCPNITVFDTRTDRFLAPTGVDLANSYDSPFPLILTCAFTGAGTIAKFHLFAALQVLLILLSSWLVARILFREESWRICYVLFAWWTGFYIARVHEHYTLLSGIWGFQLLLWVGLTLDVRVRRQMAVAGLALALIFAGTFHNIAMLTVPVLIMLGYVLWTQRAHIKNRNFAVNLLTALGVFALVFGYLFGPFIRGFFTQNLRRLPSDRVFYNLDLVSPFVPHPQNLIYKVTGYWSQIPSEAFNAIDLIVLAGALWALSRKSFWKSSFNKVLFAIALICYVVSLGPAILFNHHLLFENPLDQVLAHLPPFSFSRTPGRFASVTALCLIFIAIRFLHERWAGKGWRVPALLIAWIVITGPVLNQEIFLPTWSYRSFFPMNALESVRQAPQEFIAVQIPAAYSQDPAQNFMQIFHGKRITSGYLSYTSYTDEALMPHANDPFLSQLGCDRSVLPYRGADIMHQYDQLRAYVNSKNLRVWMLNKRILADPNCAPLLAWVKEVAKQPWIKAIEENENYAILAVQ